MNVKIVEFANFVHISDILEYQIMWFFCGRAVGSFLKFEDFHYKNHVRRKQVVADFF